MRARTRGSIALRGAAWVALALATASPAAAQSAADLRSRVIVDGRTDDWSAVEAAFRSPDLCSELSPPLVCPDAEEPADDSRTSVLQDVSQVRVTWDATNLYIAVEARLDQVALLVFLDVGPGGLVRASQLATWRRALEFGPTMRPDLVLAVGDRETVPELFRASGEERAVQVAVDQYAAAASFEPAGVGRALEAALPWSLVFPGAASGTDSEPGAPVEPMFVLPPASAAQGLRIAVAVVEAAEGGGAVDVAPDPTAGVPFDGRSPTTIDRAVRVDWDENGIGPPHFVDFGAGVQIQAASRFVPTPPAAAVMLRLANLRTFVAGQATRLLIPDAGMDLQFGFDVETPEPPVLYVTARIVSLRGDRVRELYRDAPRTAGAATPPYGRYADPARDRWNGLDGSGHPVPAGIYVLQLGAGVVPGSASVEERRAITVVR